MVTKLVEQINRTPVLHVLLVISAPKAHQAILPYHYSALKDITALREQRQHLNILVLMVPTVLNLGWKGLINVYCALKEGSVKVVMG